MQTSKFLFSIGFGFLITFGLLSSFAQASNQAMETLLPNANIIYVDANAKGEGNGEDWANAYTILQDALAVATPGDQIWVAEGIYHPDRGSGQVNDAVTSTFALLEGVALYGGFDPDNEINNFEDRNWLAYPTVLSGDIDHENDTYYDLTDDHGVVTTTDHIRGNNAYHVVSSRDVTATAILDGFFITAGKANGIEVNGDGGGMHNDKASPTLTNITFSGNYASADGGGMCNSSAKPTLTNVVFTHNAAERYGGGIANYSSNPTLTSVTLLRNIANDDGGGMYNDESHPILFNTTFNGNSAESGGGMNNHHTSYPSLINVTFSGNHAETYGGAIYNATSDPQLINVTICGNAAETYGGGIYNLASNPTLTNTILWDNTASSGREIYNNTISDPSRPLISFSDILGCFDNDDNWDETLGINGGHNLALPPLFELYPDPGWDGNWDGVDDSYGDLRPKLYSPVVDKGTNDGCPAIDRDGGPRPINVICDMGAYETGYGPAINKTVDDDTIIPGQTLVFTVSVDNRDLDVTEGVISDTLPAGLNFLGPLDLKSDGKGSTGSFPILATNLEISYTGKVTITFPVTVSYGLEGGTELTNIATISTTEMITPMLASVSLNVQNVAPVAWDDEGPGFRTDKDTPFTTPNVLANDSDPNGDTLTISTMDDSNTKGSVINNGDGTFNYNPNGQFEAPSVGGQATDTFTYTVSDGHGGTNTATVTITIYGMQEASSIYLPLVIH